MVLKKLISVVIPCFNEEENIYIVYSVTKKILDRLSKYDYEILFVDNGSADNSRREIIRLVHKNKKVKGVFLSRNFGPEASAQACFDYASGDATISIACDLQEPPELILKFIQKWEEGNHIVVGVYTKSEDNFIMTFIRKMFYRIFKKISNMDIPVSASGVGLLDRKALNAIKALPEKYRFFRGLRAWVGFKTSFISYKKNIRNKGKSSYNFIDYIKHAERGVFGFSYLLLDIIIYFGFVLVFFSFLFILVYLLLFFLFGNPIKGSVTILISIVFFGGVQLLAISVLGKYIQVIVEETKSRPVYIVDETINIS